MADKANVDNNLIIGIIIGAATGLSAGVLYAAKLDKETKASLAQKEGKFLDDTDFEPPNNT